MRCPACGRDNREAARFCDGCGQAVEPRCPACGRTLRAEARFCDGCGSSIGLPPAPSSAAPAAGRPAGAAAPRVPAAYTPEHLARRILQDGQALRGERKEVTVLFVDLQGSTELAETLGPEDFHAVMDGAFQLMLDAVHRWEGTVNQFTGDGIMALFGAPIALEDHARRALHAALQIQRGLGEYATTLRRERGVSIQARLGLNSGSVVVGAIGDDLRMDYTAQGLTTNLAARMQQAADPGSILVAAPTYRLGEGYFRFRALGPIRARGVSEPVEAYVLEGEGSVVSRLEASLRRGVSPFRGREPEMLRLGEAWQRACTGAGEAVCLVGEPGIGKSRLAHELRRSLGIAPPVEAAALGHARGAAYFVARQLLRDLAGVDAAADLAAVRDALHRRLWDLSPELAAAVPDLFAILCASCEPLTPAPGQVSDERRERLKEAVFHWLAAECRRAPRLILVEDLQWIDPSSEELLLHLMLRAGSVPVLFLMTSRLALAGSRLELARVTEVHLSPLQTGDIQALVDAQVEPYPASDRLRRLVAERSRGNPFYCEELVRALREHGDLVLDRGRYDVRESAERTMPPSVSALISSRVDRLPGSARELIADAAVLGLEFPMAHLRAMAAPDQFEDDLVQLERRGLLDRHGGAPVTRLAFRHVLTQEVVHGALVRADRHVRHRRAAETLEQLYRGRTEEVCDQIAHQWTESDQPLRALPYLVRAADGAVAVGGNREAIDHLQLALRLASEHPDALERTQIDAIRLKLAGLLFMVGER